MSGRRAAGTVRDRAVIYARISMDRAGAGLGVDRQLEDCRKLARDRGWTVVAELDDNDISAYSGKRRPGYERLLEMMRAGELDIVVAWHTDRLHRSPRELEGYIDASASAISTHTVQSGELDLATPAGRAVARTLGAWARYESEQKAVRVSRARQQEAERGLMYQLGYGWRKRRGSWEIVPEQAEVIRDVATRLLGGETLGSVVRDLNTRQVPTPGSSTWTHRTVTRVAGLDAADVSVRVLDEIRRRLESGDSPGQIASDLRQRKISPPTMRWRSSNLRQLMTRAALGGQREYAQGSKSGMRGEIVGTGNWQAIITEAEMLALRALLLDTSRDTRPQRESIYLLSGVLRCGQCGHRMYGATGRRKLADGSEVRTPRYHCQVQPGLGRCGGVAITGEPVEEMIIEAVITRLTGARLRKSRDRKAKVDTESLLDELKAAEQMEIDLAEDMASGRMSRAAWLRAQEQVERRIEKARAGLATQTSAAALSRVPTASEGHLRTWWSSADLETRRAVIVSMIERVTVSKARNTSHVFDPSRLSDPVWRV